MTHASPGSPRRVRGGFTLYMIVAVVFVLVLGACSLLTNLSSLQQPVMKDMSGHQVDADQPLTPNQAALQHVVAPDPADRFIVPSQGLNVPLGSLALTPVLEPPTFTAAYWIRDLGVEPGSKANSGTVFVVMHSLRGGGLAPGNYLYDVTTGQSRVQNGDQIRVNGVTYLVDGYQEIKKDLLPSQNALWARQPGRLVVITCLELPNGAPSQDNFILTAHLVG